MGEYADEIVDSMIDGWRGCRDFGRRLRPRPKKQITCNYCGEHPLYWMMHNDAWRLHSYDAVNKQYVLHQCNWQPRRDSNPLLMLERHLSYTR